jgi:hypothetical protein
MRRVPDEIGLPRPPQLGGTIVGAEVTLRDGREEKSITCRHNRSTHSIITS